MLTLFVMALASIGAYTSWHEAQHLNDLDKRLK